MCNAICYANPVFETSVNPISEGAGSRIRTDDLLITNQLLYQLSYAGLLLGKSTYRTGGEVPYFTVILYGLLVKQRKPTRTWERTRLQGLVRHKSGRYYARAFAGGKAVWKSLKTSHFSVAQARLTEFLKSIESDGATARVESRRK